MAQYLADEDQIRQWRDECSDFDVNATVSATTSELFASWKKWSRRTGCATARFSERLANSGAEHHRQNDARGSKGIAVKPPKATL